MNERMNKSDVVSQPPIDAIRNLTIIPDHLRGSFMRIALSFVLVFKSVGRRVPLYVASTMSAAALTYSACSDGCVRPLAGHIRCHGPLSSSNGRTKAMMARFEMATAARPAALLAVVVAVLAIMVAGCGDDSSPSGPDDGSVEGSGSPTMSPVSQTATPQSTPTDTPAPLGRLEEVLGNGEFLAVRPLARPNLIYAVKAGREVTVWKRDIVGGDEQEILQYVEPAEAQHSFNTWEEMPPGVTLSTDREVLVYTSVDGVFTFDLNRRESEVLARAVEHQVLPGGGGVFGTDLSYAWETSGGEALCCGRALAAPKVSADASWVVVQVAQYEGAFLAIWALDGSASCFLSHRSPWVDSGRPSWSASNELLIPSVRSEYSTDGLFVVAEPDRCSEQMIADELEEVNPRWLSGFFDAAWSPDGEWLATSYKKNPPQGEATDEPWSGIALMRRDGSDMRMIAPEQYSLSPIFSPDGQSVFFAQDSGGGSGPQSLWRFDVNDGQVSKVATIPQGWSVRTEHWTEEGYLMLSASSSECRYKSCNNSMILLDVSNGGVVYASPSSDFTRFLGFVE